MLSSFVDFYFYPFKSSNRTISVVLATIRLQIYKIKSYQIIKVVLFYFFFVPLLS